MKLFEYRLSRKKNKKGITAMSIVDDPAILINFLKLSDERKKAEDKREVIPQEFENDVMLHLKKVGQTQKELEDLGYKLIAVDDRYTDEGKKLIQLAIESEPDESSFLDNPDYAFRFRYNGPRDSKNRDFCANVLDLNLLYRKEDINQMSFRRENQDFGTYSIFQWKGSYNCRHKWSLETYLKTNNQRIQNIPAVTPDFNSDALDVNPKVGLSKEGDSVTLSVNKDQKIVTGPALVPNLKIFRTAESLGTEEDGYMYFSEKTVKDLAYLFMTSERMNSTTLGHEKENEDLKLIESWIVEDPKMDKCVSLGFEVPKGTWMVSYKVQNDDLWKRIKDGEFNGFSIEATDFDMIEKPLEMADENPKVELDEEQAAKILVFKLLELAVPNSGESEDDFIPRCIKKVIDDGTAKDEDQAFAICKSIWDNK